MHLNFQCSASNIHYYCPLITIIINIITTTVISIIRVATSHSSGTVNILGRHCLHTKWCCKHGWTNWKHNAAMAHRNFCKGIQTSLWSLLSYLRMLTTWHCPHSAAAAAAIDRYLLPTGLMVANPQQWVCCRGSVLGQTDGQCAIS